ncbi:MAG: thioredoxin family protein [Deltaproteobacteria bacterium]|nr:thioredoxin family protein [Deltaproteobacteria bacterium]
MIFPRLFVGMALASAFLFVGACSDDTTLTPDQGIIYPDLQAPDQAVTCGVGVYPCGPYGTTNGTIAANEVFLGYKDPDNFCKAHKDKKADYVVAPKSISFGDWYKKPSACDKKYKILWVNVAAGWCGPCRAEVQSLAQDFAAGAFDPEVDFLNIVFEDSSRKPATPGFAKTWGSTQKLNWPVVSDPAFVMG